MRVRKGGSERASLESMPHHLPLPPDDPATPPESSAESAAEGWATRTAKCAPKPPVRKGTNRRTQKPSHCQAWPPLRVRVRYKSLATVKPGRLKESEYVTKA
eukprot:7420279-Pyramimonas_sp.AAC.2